MNDIAALIKLAALDAVEADKPVAVMLGRVIADSPAVIEIEQKLRLSGGLLMLLRGAELETGDTAVLLRVQGGQSFIVLGRL
jgi:hypothetical protein